MNKLLSSSLLSILLMTQPSLLKATESDSDEVSVFNTAEEHFASGVRFSRGEGDDPVDYTKAKSAFDEALKIGLPPKEEVASYQMLAEMNFQGQGMVEPDFSEARLYFNKALEVEGSPAESTALTQWFLGCMDLMGKGLVDSTPNHGRGTAYIAMAYSSGRLPEDLAAQALGFLKKIH